MTADAVPYLWDAESGHHASSPGKINVNQRRKKHRQGALPKVPPASAALSPHCLLQDFQCDFVQPLKQGLLNLGQVPPGRCFQRLLDTLTHRISL